MRTKAGLPIALLVGSLVCANAAGQAASDPDAIYTQIALIERVMPAERSVAQLIDLGRAYSLTGRAHEAQLQAQLAVAKDPANADGLMLLGDALMQKRLYRDALSAFNRVAQLRPRSARAQHRRGEALSGMGLPREAEAARGLYQTLSGKNTQ